MNWSNITLAHCGIFAIALALGMLLDPSRVSKRLIKTVWVAVILAIGAYLAWNADLVRAYGAAYAENIRYGLAAVLLGLFASSGVRFFMRLKR